MIEGVFRHHDRSKFEIFAYSIGKNLDGVMLQKIKNNVDTFRDLQSISGTEIALSARGDQINIAIDLAGYTKIIKQSYSINAQRRFRLISLDIQGRWVQILWIILLQTKF